MTINIKNKTILNGEEVINTENLQVRGCKISNGISKPKILFAKIKEGTKIPTKILENAAYDIYACFDEDYIVIKPHQTRIVPTGICSSFDHNWVAILKERGSTGVIGLSLRAGVIDSGYRGEWNILLTNTTDHNIFISKFDKETTFDKFRDTIGSLVEVFTGTCGFIIDGAFVYPDAYYDVVYPYSKAIAQCMMASVPQFDVEEVDYITIQLIKSERMDGKFGSSGK